MYKRYVSFVTSVVIGYLVFQFEVFGLSKFSADYSKTLLNDSTFIAFLLANGLFLGSKVTKYWQKHLTKKEI